MSRSVHAIVPFLLSSTLCVVFDNPVLAQPFEAPVRPAVTPRLQEPAGPAQAATNDYGSRGSFSLLSYNIAGIPQFFSDQHPARNTVLIGPLLNQYDLVLVQEDFMYHEDLSAGAEHPHRSPPFPVAQTFATLGDGLHRFSRFPIESFERRSWRICSGLLTRFFDCTARKGYTYARVRLSADVSIDVYNLHFDAGGRPRDIHARTVQTDRLIEAVQLRSTGRAVIIAGDLNFRSHTTDFANLERLIDALALRDACDFSSCDRQRVDRVFVRSGRDVTLDARGYGNPTEFVDGDGEQLSDHWPVATTIDWWLESRSRLSDRD